MLLAYKYESFSAAGLWGFNLGLWLFPSLLAFDGDQLSIDLPPSPLSTRQEGCMNVAGTFWVQFVCNQRRVINHTKLRYSLTLAVIGASTPKFLH